MWIATLAVLLFANPAVRADEPKDDPAPKPKVEVIKDKLLFLHDGKPSKFYLGMRLSNVPEALDAQLALDGGGAVVMDVVKDGPAAKAGVKPHDVVLAVGDKTVKRFGDVTAAVDAADGKEVTLKLLRAGKPVTVSITPGKREDLELSLKPKIVRAEEEDEETLELIMEDLEEKIHDKLEALKDAGVDVRLQMIKPGKFVPHGVGVNFRAPGDFPDDLSITIRKQGKEPAQIEVKQGDKSWAFKEDEFGKVLPEQLQQYVGPFLGRPTKFTVALPGGKQFNVPVPPPVIVDLEEKSERAAEHARARAEHVRARAEWARESVERRVEEMSRNIERMREQMESLRRSLQESQREADKDDK
jgi:hypothetical protein